MTLLPRRRMAWLVVAGLCVLLLFTCDEQSEKDKSRQAEAQRQAQLEAAQVQRLKAEQDARAAEASRDFWIIVLGCGACVGCVLVLLAGIHIGSGALARYRKDQPHE